MVSKLAFGLELIYSKGAAILVAPALGFTAFGVYSLLRVWFPASPDTSDHGDVMQSYQHNSESLLTWKLWVVSCGIGGVNAILLVVAYLMLSGGWPD